MERTVYFRAFEPEDAELIYKWMNDDELKKMSIGVNRRMCREEAEDWVKARMRDNRSQIFWAICAKDTNQMIGYMSLSDIHYVNRSANFSGIVIGDSRYQDGFAWLESYLFVYEYVFERLGLNRVYGESIIDHKMTSTMRKLMMSTVEGVLRQAVYKNGQFYDVVVASVLKDEYFKRKAEGEYELKSVLKRLRQLHKE